LAAKHDNFASDADLYPPRDSLELLRSNLYRSILRTTAIPNTSSSANLRYRTAMGFSVAFSEFG